MNQGTSLGSQVGRWILLAALAVALGALLLTIRPAGAQDNGTIKYAEKGTGPVTTLTATDPEGAMITWSVLASDDTGIPIDVNGDGDTTDAVDIVAADAADSAHFEIENGVLSFATSPDFEMPRGAAFDTANNNNTYNVVVVASDMMTGGMRGYEEVTVEVTNVDEDGTVTWAIQPTSALTATDVNGGEPVMQFQVGAILTATANDGDVSATATLTNTGWRWYSSSSKTDPGTTPIATATTNSYTVQPTDVGNYIHVQAFYYVGSGLQEEASLASDYPVLGPAPDDSDPEFDPATVTRMVDEGEKGMDVGAPVTATGGHGQVNYALTGTGGDDDRFEIDPKTGQITTKWDLDRESDSAATADTAGSCAEATTDTPDTDCTVTVTVTDSAGETATATVTITLGNVDDKPTFTTGVLTASVEEGTTQVDATAYAATDPEDGLVTLTLMGADGGLFTLSSTDILSFRTAPDYENPADTNEDNVYEVTVRASDGALYADRMVAVTVTNADEAPEINEIDSPIEYAEGGMDAVATFTAMDPDGDMISWTATGLSGTDAGLFSINSDGVLSFSTSPDYEASTTGDGGGDANNDNTYEVTVTASSTGSSGGALTDTFDLEVDVTDVPETGEVTWETAPDGSTDTDPTVAQFQVGTRLTATATDGDVAGTSKTVTSNLRWQWFSSSSRTSPGSTALTTGVTSSTGTLGDIYTVQATDVGKYIHVRAIYTEGTAQQRMLLLSSGYQVLATMPTGTAAPAFASTTVTRMVNEGEKGMNVGAPVTVTGGYGVVNYGLAGDDADRFEIDPKTGQITTDVDLDSEGVAVATASTLGSCAGANGSVADPECTVTVSATDSAGQAAPVATVTINIESVDDKPAFGDVVTTDGSEANLMTAEVAENATGTDLNIATYTATDQDGGRVNLSLMGADSSLFKLSPAATPAAGSGILSLKASPDYENPMDANGDNVYEVTVRAMDTTGMYVDRMVMVTVTQVNEAPVIMRGGLAVSGRTSETFAEDGTGAVATYTATGPDADSATWSTGGVDGSRFRMEGSGASAMLMFSPSPDFENPADDGRNNIYNVTVMATDGTYDGSRQVEVTVTNVDEDGMVTLMPASPVAGNAVTAELTDPDAPDGVMGTVSWQWLSSADGMAGTFTNITGATTDSYTPDAAMYLMAMATYTDAHGSQDATSASVGVMELMVSGMAAVNYAENGTGPVAMYTTNASSDATWTLSGADMDDLSISDAGVLTFNDSPDYEAPTDADGDNVYKVTVEAAIGSATASMDVDINVRDVDEGPVARYDRDDDGAISIAEMFSAIDDYFEGGITISEMFEVIDAYFENNG